MPRRLHLEGDDLEALRAHAQLRFPHGRIVSAERVRTGGIGRFLAREHYELVVEIPEQVQRPRPGGLEALLEDADAAEESLRTTVSTQSHRFAELLDSLTATTGAPPPPPHPARVPLPYTGSGDLIVVLGAGGAAARVAGAMQRWAGAPSAALLSLGGTEEEPGPPVQTRHRMRQARATGVEDGHGTYVALDLGHFGEVLPQWAPVVRLIAPDQVWLAVDARLKHTDSQEWVRQVRDVVGVDALAVEGLTRTQTPHTVHELGLPVGWSDDSPTVHPPS